MIVKLVSLLFCGAIVYYIGSWLFAINPVIGIFFGFCALSAL